MRRRGLGGLASAQLRRPGMVLIVGFASAIAVLTVVLMLPVAHEDGASTTFRQALFTATSAVCVTGLTVVDTPTHWSTVGEIAIISGVQFGGLGFMVSASLLGLAVARRMGLRSRILAAAETRSEGIGDVGRVVRGVAVVSLSVQAVVAVVLGLRFWLGYDQSFGQAAYNGAFLAISAFNNAGFALFTDNLVGFETDAVVCLSIAAAVLIGGARLPGALRAGQGARHAGALVPAHEDHTVRQRTAARRRDGRVHRVRVAEQRHPRPAERSGQAARGLLLRRRPAELGGLQLARRTAS